MSLDCSRLPGQDEKKWFFIFSQGHYGPMSLLDILNLEREGKISSKQPIWMEGFKKDISLQTLKSAYLLKTPPLVPEFKSSVTMENEIMTEEDPIEVVEKKTYRWWPLTTLEWGVISVLIMVVFFKFNFSFKNKKPTSLDQHEWAKLEQFWKDEPTAKSLHFLLVGKDYGDLFWQDKETQTCRYYLKLSSQRILGAKSISFFSYAYSNKGLVHFKNISFISGAHLVPGFYQGEIIKDQCQGSFFRSAHANQTTALSTPIYRGNNSELVALLDKQDETFIKIKRMNQTLKEKKILASKIKNPIKTSKVVVLPDELQMRLKTLEVLSLEAEKKFLWITKHKSKSKTAVRMSVDEYTKEIGSHLTALTIENEKAFSMLSKKVKKQKDPHLSAMLKFSTLAKRLGFDSMSFIESLHKKQDMKTISKDFKKWQAQLDSIRKELNQTEVSFDDLK
jgi:hypothetical protein